MPAAIDGIDPETRAFYDRHCSTPGGVVLAHIYDSDGDEMETGVFSSLAKAHEWVGTRVDATAAVFSPYVIDAPEYGNVPDENLN